MSEGQYLINIYRSHNFPKRLYVSERKQNGGNIALIAVCSESVEAFKKKMFTFVTQRDESNSSASVYNNFSTSCQGNYYWYLDRVRGSKKFQIHNEICMIYSMQTFICRLLSFLWSSVLFSPFSPINLTPPNKICLPEVIILMFIAQFQPICQL